MVLALGTGLGDGIECTREGPDDGSPAPWDVTTWECEPDDDDDGLDMPRTLELAIVQDDDDIETGSAEAVSLCSLRLYYPLARTPFGY